VLGSGRKQATAYDVLNSFVEFRRKSAYITLESEDRFPLTGISNCQSPTLMPEAAAGMEYVTNWRSSLTGFIEVRYEYESGIGADPTI
jgi:hypothetical protein